MDQRHPGEPRMCGFCLILEPFHTFSGHPFLPRDTPSDGRRRSEESA